MSKVTIAATALEPDRFGVCHVRVREPGIIRALGFGVKQASLISVPGQPQELDEHVVAFVECWPDGAFVDRQFVVKGTNRLATAPDGCRAVWVATGISATTGAVAHAFEIVPVEAEAPT